MTRGARFYRFKEISNVNRTSPAITVDPALASAAVAAAGDAIVTSDSHGLLRPGTARPSGCWGISAEQAIGQTLGL